MHRRKDPRNEIVVNCRIKSKAFRPKHSVGDQACLEGYLMERTSISSKMGVYAICRLRLKSTRRSSVATPRNVAIAIKVRNSSLICTRSFE